ncbi:hypothetical protein ACRAWD_17930 [Caulobacter segnis]
MGAMTLLAQVGAYSAAGLTPVKAGVLRRSGSPSFKKTRISDMTGGQTAYLVLVIAAFAAFSAALLGTSIYVNRK